jgi:hypothetical protein
LPSQEALGRNLENALLPRTAGAILAEMGLENSSSNRAAITALAEWGLPAEPETVRIIDEATARMTESSDQKGRYAAFLASRGITPSASLLDALTQILQGTSPPLNSGVQQLPFTQALLSQGQLPSQGLPTSLPSAHAVPIDVTVQQFHPLLSESTGPFLNDLIDRITQRTREVVRSDPVLTSFRNLTNLLQNPIAGTADSESKIARQLLLLFQNTAPPGSENSPSPRPEWAAQILKTLSLPPHATESEITTQLKQLASPAREALGAQLTQQESEWIQKHPVLSNLSRAFQEIEQTAQRLQLMKLWSPPSTGSGDPSPTLSYAGEWSPPTLTGSPDHPERLFLFYRPSDSDSKTSSTEEGTAYIDIRLSRLDRLKIFVELRGQNVSIRIDSTDETIRQHLELSKERLLHALDSLDLTTTVQNRLASDPSPPPEEYRSLSEELDRFFWVRPEGEFHGIDLHI